MRVVVVTVFVETWAERKAVVEKIEPSQECFQKSCCNEDVEQTLFVDNP